jgi:hypothetical protein
MLNTNGFYEEVFYIALIRIFYSELVNKIHIIRRKDIIRSVQVRLVAHIVGLLQKY